MKKENAQNFDRALYQALPPETLLMRLGEILQFNAAENISRRKKLKRQFHIIWPGRMQKPQ